LDSMVTPNLYLERYDSNNPIDTKPYLEENVRSRAFTATPVAKLRMNRLLHSSSKNQP